MAEVIIKFSTTETRHYEWKGDAFDLPRYIRERLDENDQSTWLSTINGELDSVEIQNLVDDDSSGRLEEVDDEDDYDVDSVVVILDESTDDDQDDDQPDQEDQEVRKVNGYPIIKGACPFLACWDTDCGCDCQGCSDARRTAADGSAEPVPPPPEPVAVAAGKPRPF